MKVKNLENTIHLKPPFGKDWIECWEIKKRREAEKCNHCISHRNLVAHVQDQNGKKYIVPLCQECNLGLSTYFEVCDSDLLPLPIN